ncbi:MAG: DUF4139 domain-containing protein [Spirochaetes bacterium]|nr:DUF4139 domain-containing protein [Spirochaetota bacterium]
MKKTRSIVCMIILISFFSAFNINAGNKKTKIPEIASVKIDRIVLFKNGLGYFTSSADLPKNRKIINIGQLPVPSYGTFWVSYPKNLKLSQLVTAPEEIEMKQPASGIGQLLAANAGKRVIIKTSPDGKIIEGVILDSFKPEKNSGKPSPYIMDNTVPSLQGRPDNYSSSSGIILIDTGKGIAALNTDTIAQADFHDKEISNYIIKTQYKPGIRIELKEPVNNAKIHISYLAHGITWCPSYYIDLSDKKTALLTAKALVINEVTDLENVKLELVTGFPNIKFEAIHSPAAMTQSLSDFLNSLSSGSTGPRRSAVMMNQAVMMNDSYAEEAEFSGPSYSTAPKGTVAEDLFLYPVKDFSLKRGETAYIPLFSARMPYSHIYTWKIDDMLSDDNRYQQRQNRDNGKAEEEVWHSCRLKNTGKLPLTTAPAEFVSSGNFSGQDICYYTAPGAETTIRINRAMNILAEQDEFEIKRERNAATFYGYTYDLVNLRGELKLKNRLAREVSLEVIKKVSGEVLKTEIEAKDVTTAKGLKKVNPQHILTWTFDLKAGNEQALTYEYQVYIRP